MASNTITASLLLKTGQFNKQLGKVQSKLNRLGGISQTLGRTMQYAVGGALIAAGAASVKAAIDFDLTLQKLKALAGPENALGVDRLAKTARRLGANSIYTASQVAEMQLSLKKLGLEVGTIDNMSESVLKFATAMDVDVNTAGETVINTMKKFTNSFSEFGTEQEKAAAISEQFAAATVNSALKFDSLRSSLNYAGAEANAAGFSFDQTAAILGKLADAGFNGSRGGIILRKVLQSVGKQGGNTLDNFNGLINSQKEFNEVMKIVGVRAAGGTLALGGLGDEIDLLAKLIRESTGQVDAFSEAVEGSFMGRLRNVVSALEEVGIALLTQFEKPLKSAITKFAQLIRTIDAEDVRKFGNAISTLAKVMVASQLLSITAGFVRNFGLLKGVFFDLAAKPFGKLIASELGLLRAGLASFATNPVVLAFIAMTAGIKNVVDMVARAKAEIKGLADATAGAEKTQLDVNKAFEGLVKLAPEEVFKRLRDGAVSTMMAWENGEFAADGKAVADLFIPKDLYDEIMERARGMEGQFGATFEEALARSVAMALPKIKSLRTNLDDIDGLVSGGIKPDNLKELTQLGFTKFIAGTKLVDDAASGAAISLIEQSDAVKELIASRDLVGGYNPISLDSKVGEETDWAQQMADATLLAEQAAQLQNAFVGVGNIIGNAFQQAATGARAFGDALKQNLISAISAVISKLIALSAAYGLAALAKAFLDGGTSIAQAATAITSSGFGSFLQGGMGMGSMGTQVSSIRTTGYVAGSDLVLTTGRGINANDRLYG